MYMLIPLKIYKYDKNVTTLLVLKVFFVLIIYLIYITMNIREVIVWNYYSLDILEMRQN